MHNVFIFLKTYIGLLAQNEKFKETAKHKSRPVT
jgi:hypothetical protein